MVWSVVWKVCYRKIKKGKTVLCLYLFAHIYATPSPGCALIMSTIHAVYDLCTTLCFSYCFAHSSFHANNLRGMAAFAKVNEFQRDPGGALSSFRYPISLLGVTNFTQNIGGGLSVINTEVGVEKNAQVLFQENKAIFGGGIQMEENCRVSLYCS